METVTADQFKNKYGGIATAKFGATSPEDNLFSSIKNDLSSRQENMVGSQSPGYNSGSATDTGYGILHNAAQVAGGVMDVAGDVATHAPGVGGLFSAAGNALKTGFNKVTDALSNTSAIKQYAAQNPEPNKNPVERFVGGLADAGAIANVPLMGDMGAGALSKATGAASKIPEAVGNIPKPGMPNVVGMAENIKGTLPSAAQDVLPSTQNWINHNISKALELSPGDLTKIGNSTGNDIGKWMADNNLIGKNKAGTQSLIDAFQQTNYKAVRSEIAKVTTQYKMSQIPGYADALNVLQKQVTDVPGMETEAVKVDNLLHPTKPLTLEDVQTVKEMIDDHFKLYNQLGDVAENTAKQGVANMRSKLKTFIENQVKENTGADISKMNNNVATAKSLTNAIETRAAKEITGSKFGTRDVMMGLGLTYFTSPLIGVAAVFLKKVMTSPAARLRFARFLDKQSDAYKAKLSQSLKEGNVPSEVEKATEVSLKPGTPTPTPESAPSPKSNIFKTALDNIKNNGEKGAIKNPLYKGPDPIKIAQKVGGEDIPAIQDFVNNPSADTWMKLQPMLEAEPELADMQMNQLQDFLKNVIDQRNAPDFKPAKIGGPTPLRNAENTRLAGSQASIPKVQGGDPNNASVPIVQNTTQVAESIERQIKASSDVYKEYTPEMLKEEGGLQGFLKYAQQNISLELKSEGHPEEAAYVKSLDVKDYASWEDFTKELKKIEKSTPPPASLEMKGGWKDNFDNALMEKDAATVQKLLPYVPDYYKARFEKEIADVVKTNQIKPR